MAKTCGIHLTERRFELVALDGSAKKPKVRLCLSGAAPADADDPLEAVSDALRGAAKAHRKQLTIEEVGLCLDSSLATYRYLSLPFADKDKIEEVLKFEVESQLPQWEIDEVICDFVVLDSTPVESHLLVTAVPKDEIAVRLDIAARAGLEPLDAEVDSTALFRAAEHADMLDAEGAQLLVHFGPRTTTLVTASGGKLAAARALTLDLREFDRAAGEAAAGEAAGDGSADGEAADGAEAGEAAQAAPDSPALSAARTDALLARVRRELSRTMSSLQSDLEVNAVMVCGLELPGLVGDDVGGVRVERLDPLEGQVDLPVEDRSRLVIAFGTALGRLGVGDFVPHLRREELTYASKFERLELPLGVLGLLVLTLLASVYITDGRVLEQRKEDVWLWLVVNRNYAIGQVPNYPEVLGHLRPTEEEVQNTPLFAYMMQTANLEQRPNGDSTRTYRQQLQHTSSLLDRQIAKVEEQLGAARDITPPMSALSGLNMVLDVIKELDEDSTLGRFSIRRADSTYLSGKGNNSDRVKVELNLTFFGENDLDATEGYTALMNELNAKPWITDRVDQPSTTVLETGGGIAANGIEILVDTTKAELEG